MRAGSPWEAASGTGATTGQTDHPTTGAPTGSGAVAVRGTLTASTAAVADANGIANAGCSYRWFRMDGAALEDISEASTSTCKVRLGDIGKQLAAQVCLP